MPIQPANAVTIAEAAARLRAGELVAFPTETVYGLGANALDATAVAKIFAAKGRPASNPVIVHIFDTAQAQALAREWPVRAEALAAAFWPGPLTLVLQKREIVPSIVTAGGDTVALRVPGHPVALALLKECQVPLAAPSANRSTEVSPTCAEHVASSFGNAFPILDGGPCSAGIESTVLDLTGEQARILRPGSVTAAMIESVIGNVLENAVQESIAKSPGQMRKHYSPKAKVILVKSVQGLEGEVIAVDCDAAEYAARLYARLHDADAHGAKVIYVEEPPETGEWIAVRDRLKRASD